MRETLASLVEDWRRLGGESAVARHRGNRVFRTTYRELAMLAGRFAAELDRRGIQAGERVVLWGENSPEWIAAFFGCLLRGVLAVPLDAAGTAAFAARVHAEVAPSLLVGDSALIAGLLTGVPHLVFAELRSVLPAEALLTPSEAVAEATPFQIVFTSGTTSEPKGVVHTHRNVLASLRPIETEIGRYRRYERWFHPLRFLHTLPFSHVFGQFMGLWVPPLLGAELHLPEGVEARRLLGITKRERISVLVAVPRVLEVLRDHLRARWPSLEQRLAASAGVPAWKRWWRFREVHRAFGWKFWALICGGATLPTELESFWNGLGFALVQGYGMTETAALVTLNHPFKVGKGTLGKPLPGRELRLSPEGEILVRGQMLAAGAWQGGRFQPRTEEWLATGDLAVQDADGALRFGGRRGDLIVTAAGMNVHPADVEAALLRQPSVRACVVIACNGPLGPEPVGVVLSAGDEAALRAVREGANRDLADFQKLRTVLRWPEPAFPFTPTGKLLRRQVTAWACGQLAGSRHALPTERNGHDGVSRVLAEVAPQAAGMADDELVLDSLGRVQLQAALEERFGVALPDEQLAGARTVAELRALVDKGSTAHPGTTPANAGPAVASSPVRYARWPASAPVRWLRTFFFELVAVPLVKLLANPRVTWTERLPDTGPLLIVANHVNTFDLPLILYALGTRRRQWLATAMSAEVLDDLRRGRNGSNAALRLLEPVAYWLSLALFHVFPLPRLRGFRESFAHAGELLDRGYSVLVFPEGRRGWTGELQPLRPGVGLLVEASQVPVLPVALQGVGSRRRAGGRWFRPPGLAVHVGAPVNFALGSNPEEITRQIEAALRALRPS